MHVSTDTRMALLTLLLVPCLFQSVCAGEITVEDEVEQYGIFERVLYGPNESDCNPFLDVHVNGSFTFSSTNAQKVTMNVFGFYDGQGVYRIRFMPNLAGRWSYHIVSNVASPTSQDGSFVVKAPISKEGSLNHGVARSKGMSEFCFDDGTPYNPLGTTAYAWLHQPEGDPMEERTLKTLAASPFNKIRMTIFPKWYPFTHHEPRYYPYIRNENQTSFDFSRFNVTFWQHLEERVVQMRDDQIGKNLIVEFILFHPYDGGHWGFDSMNENVQCQQLGGGDGSWCDLHYIRYVTARLSAYRHIWWSMANEWDLMKAKTVDDWNQLFLTLQSTDPYNHERSIHNCMSYYNHSQPWISHVSLQGHAVGQLDMTKATWTRKPIVWDEVEYEGNITYGWGDITGEMEAQRGWEAVFNGVFMGGHSNTALRSVDIANCTGQEGPNNLACNAIMWWNKGDVMFGDSPVRLGFMNKWLRQLPSAVASFNNINFSKPNGQHVPTYLLKSKENNNMCLYFASQEVHTGSPVSKPNLAPVTIPLLSKANDCCTFSQTAIDYWTMETHTLPILNATDKAAVVIKPVKENYILCLEEI
jgi:hypothetical protein